MKVYIAGPYSSRQDSRLQSNIDDAIEVGNKVAEAGHTPFIPHLFHFWDERFPHDYDFWIGQGQEWLKSCDAVIRLPGKSPGADAEVKLADELDITVYELEFTTLEAITRDLSYWSLGK